MIRNETTGDVLAGSARTVRSLLRQALGLMLRPRLDDEGWVFAFPTSSKWHLTNLFVLQPIDAVWLDADRRVLQVKTLRPFQPHASGAQDTRYVVELPAGVAAGVAPGHALSWPDEE